MQILSPCQGTWRNPPSSAYVHQLVAPLLLPYTWLLPYAAVQATVAARNNLALELSRVPPEHIAHPFVVHALDVCDAVRCVVMLQSYPHAALLGACCNLHTYKSAERGRRLARQTCVTPSRAWGAPWYGILLPGAQAEAQHACCRRPEAACRTLILLAGLY